MPDPAQLHGSTGSDGRRQVGALVRRMKSELKKNWDGTNRFPERMIRPLEADYSDAEASSTTASSRLRRRGRAEGPGHDRWLRHGLRPEDAQEALVLVSSGVRQDIREALRPDVGPGRGRRGRITRSRSRSSSSWSRRKGSGRPTTMRPERDLEAAVEWPSDRARGPDRRAACTAASCSGGPCPVRGGTDPTPRSRLDGLLPTNTSHRRSVDRRARHHLHRIPGLPRSTAPAPGEPGLRRRWAARTHVRGMDLEEREKIKQAFQADPREEGRRCASCWPPTLPARASISRTGAFEADPTWRSPGIPTSSSSATAGSTGTGSGGRGGHLPLRPEGYDHETSTRTWIPATWPGTWNSCSAR